MFKLKLKNYRGFLDQEFDFSRINILIGENSAGKSSIFKFLLALKQSLRSPNSRDYNLTLSDNETDLGNYYETIYNHEIERNLGFSFEFSKEYFDFFVMDSITRIDNGFEIEKRLIEIRDEIISHLGGYISSPTAIDFELTHDLSNHKNISTSISNNELGQLQIISNLNKDNQAEQEIYLIGQRPKCEILFKSKYFNNSFQLENVEYEKRGFLTIVDGESLKNQIKEQSHLAEAEVEKLFWHIGFLLITQNYLLTQLSDIEYINPLLSKSAERVYLDGDRKKAREIKNVKDLIDFIDANSTRPMFKENLTNLLANFGIADDFYIKKEGFTRELRIVLNDFDSNIKDVGFGVSLQLPIFAQAMISDVTRKSRNGIEFRIGETLLIEQPEVHLHPRLQAKFIENLLQIGTNNVYFIETHSEHIIRMLQYIVKTQEFGIKAEDVSINYFRKEGKNMIKSVHKINSDTGKLNPSFPTGFYDVSYNLAFQLMD